MAVFERETVVEAPLDDVWDFHSRVEGLTELTPDWMGMGVERIEGADGEVLCEGASVSLYLEPFGLSKIRWTSVITEREYDGDTAFFRDEMVSGPFKSWTHTHTFESVDEGTVVRDRVEYSLPVWMGGPLGVPFSLAGMRLVFRYRHEKTREKV